MVPATSRVITANYVTVRETTLTRLTLPQSRALSIIDGHLNQTTTKQGTEEIQETERTVWQPEGDTVSISQNKQGVVTRCIYYIN